MASISIVGNCEIQSSWAEEIFHTDFCNGVLMNGQNQSPFCNCDFYTIIMTDITIFVVWPMLFYLIFADV